MTRILFLTRYGEHLVGAPSTYHGFEQAVGKQATCKWAGKGYPDYKEGESMGETVSRVMPDADWVIDDKNRFQKLEQGRNYSVAVMISDLHGKHSHGIGTPRGFCDLINDCGYDAVFSKYEKVHGTGFNADIFKERLRVPFHSLPWSVDTGKFTGGEKTVDVTFIGAIGKPYPLRTAMYDGVYYAARGYKVVRETSPKGRTFDRTFNSYPDSYVGTRYSDLLNQTRIMLFGCSKFRYPVQKYFESMASGCLILSDQPSSAKTLGLRDRETYVDVNINEWEYELNKYLEDVEACAKIADNARRYAHTHHSHLVRAAEFVEMLR